MSSSPAWGIVLDSVSKKTHKHKLYLLQAQIDKKKEAIIQVTFLYKFSSEYYIKLLHYFIHIIISICLVKSKVTYISLNDNYLVSQYTDEKDRYIEIMSFAFSNLR